VVDEDDVTDNRRGNASYSYMHEFSPLGSVHQYTVDYWGSNLLDLFGGGESSRKGSATNLNPSGMIFNLS